LKKRITCSFLSLFVICSAAIITRRLETCHSSLSLTINNKLSAAIIVQTEW
jgi:hypothetical protein